MSRRRRMIFKFGVTVIVVIAIYMYYVIQKDKDSIDGQETGTISDDSDLKFYAVNKDESKVPHAADKSSTGDTNGKKDVEAMKAVQLQDSAVEHSNRTSETFKNGIHLSVVACGDRLEESVVMLKSAVLFSQLPLIFHIFAEPDLQQQFRDQLDIWPAEFRKRFQYHIYDLSFPMEGTSKPDEWKTLFKPCASQRLFMPSILTDVDALIYVDTDVLFLSPVDNIWGFFKSFNSTQLAALAPEHEDAAIGWYNRFARHPYYGALGVNSGVMLMNLTRLRSSAWLQSMMNYYKEYKLKITWGDQDLINIYFHFYPDQLYVYPCEWNYRPDHCMYMSICHSAEKTGAYVLHGCRRVWHSDKQPAFKAVYTAFKEHHLGIDIQYGLLEMMKRYLELEKNSNCGKVKHIFLSQIEKYTTEEKKSTR
ncbi:hypothetical protein ACJMK2_019490 [Sinanodonta woodiana]|uniref:UDP-D-xylose:beta-D-glucoside alpha-1,3-D-xylosyltransferase n=1 Tax=Sinanodonta woodiana TaxID=1069815 RepID=A0ABD3TVW3_SINWO